MMRSGIFLFILSQIVQDYTLHMACHMNDPMMMMNDKSDIVVYH